MLLYTCAVILTTICETFASDREFAPNVGTVLFSTDDLTKKRWTKDELGLLHARRYFQTLLPPPIFINTFNEDYVNILLGYFRDAYGAIKREAAEPETDSIMTTALSDAIGGYLKVWVLPVAKLDYYGGTVSQENVVKLFQFYNEIKRYLETDGDGWHNPDENVLNSVTINVAPLKLNTYTRSMKDPCEYLAYFEKTPTGLSIPIPNVNWDDKSSTMFIPLKNASLIQMHTPDTAHNLIKYYDAARSCIQSSYPTEQERFDERFQAWLNNEVVPHLKDENLYLALGSVLSLVNKTRDLCNSVIDLYGNRFNVCNRTIQTARLAPVDLSCKKMWIITIILLIEVAWCIPALIYILCTKKGHKKDCSSNVYLYIDNNKDKKDKGFYKTKRTRSSTTLEHVPCVDSGCGPPIKNGIKLFRKSQLSNMEFEAQYPSSQHTHTVPRQSSSTSKEQACYVKKSSSEVLQKNSGGGVTKKSSLKKPSEKCLLAENTNSVQMVALSSSHDGFNCSAKQSSPSYATVRRASTTFSAVGGIPCEPCSSPQRTRKSSFDECLEKMLEDRRKRKLAEECKARAANDPCQDRKLLDDIKARKLLEESIERKRAEECRKADELRRMDERRKAEEKRLEEVRKAEERRIEDRRRAEERRLDDLRRAEERRIEACRKAEELRKLEECRRAEERKLEELKKAEERRREELRRAEERRIEECKRAEGEDRKKAEELRRAKRAEERRSAELERRRAEECKKLDECKKIVERRKLEECKKLSECKYTAERKKVDVCRESEEIEVSERDSSEFDECKKLEEKQCDDEEEEEEEEEDEQSKYDECFGSSDSRKICDGPCTETYRVSSESNKCDDSDVCRIPSEDISQSIRYDEPSDDNRDKYRDSFDSKEFEKRQHLENRQNEECRRVEEKRKGDDIKKREESRKNEERHKLEESKKREESRKMEERKKNEETKKSEEVKNIEKIEERRKQDELKKREEMKKMEERKKLEEHRRAARKKIEENKKQKERKRETKKHEERRRLDDCRELEEFNLGNYDEESADMSAESRALGDQLQCFSSYIKTGTDSNLVKEVKQEVIERNVSQKHESPSECAPEESQDTETDNAVPCRKRCPCTVCVQKKCPDSMSSSTCENTSESVTDAKIEKQSGAKTTRFKVTKELKFCRGKTIKVSSGKPYLEITIDRPATEICVDMAHVRQHSSSRPSKIPKPACSTVQPITFPPVNPQPGQLQKHKSLIPQLKKKTLDDIALSKRRGSRSVDSKLNETF